VIQNKQVAVWLPRGRYHGLAVSLGLIQLPRQDYCAAIKDAEAQAEAKGLKVVVLRVAPSRIVQELEILGLANDQIGRATVYATIANEFSG
jgi:hypothetical protein